MSKFPQPSLFPILICAPIAACASTIPGLPSFSGDQPLDTGMSDAMGARPDVDATDGGTTDDNASVDDSTDVGVVDDSNGGQDVVTLDATNPGLDATGPGSDGGDGGSGITDAPPDTGMVVLDANAVCGSNLLTPTAATASSVSPGGLAAGNAIDGNLGTRWESIHAVDPQWISVDFGASVFINRVQIAWETACARNYDIQISKDATTWTTLKSIAANAIGFGPAPPPDWTTAASHTGFTGVGRYLRINGTARCTMYGYSMWEIRVYGDTNSICHP